MSWWHLAQSGGGVGTIVGLAEKSVALGVDDSSIGSIAWTNPNNIISSNNQRATAQLAVELSDGITHLLKGTMGANAWVADDLPAGATRLQSLVIRMERSCADGDPGLGSYAEDYRLSPVVGGVALAPNAIPGTPEIMPAADADQEYILEGSAIAGVPLAALLSSTFGIAYAVKLFTGSSGDGADVVTGRVDHIAITPYVFIPSVTGDTRRRPAPVAALLEAGVL